MLSTLFRVLNLNCELFAKMPHINGCRFLRLSNIHLSVIAMSSLMHTCFFSCGCAVAHQVPQRWTSLHLTALSSIAVESLVRDYQFCNFLALLEPFPVLLPQDAKATLSMLDLAYMESLFQPPSLSVMGPKRQHNARTTCCTSFYGLRVPRMPQSSLEASLRR